MDRVPKAYLDEFRTELSLDDAMPEPDLFEFFADYCVVSNLHEELDRGGVIANRKPG